MEGLRVAKCTVMTCEDEEKKGKSFSLFHRVWYEMNQRFVSDSTSFQNKGSTRCRLRH